MPTRSSEVSIRIVHHGSRTSIAVEGELDLSNRSVLRSHLDYVITDANGDIELDLGDVTYIDSPCLAEIRGAYAELLEQGRQLRVINANPQVVRRFELNVITHLLADPTEPPVRLATVASAFPRGDAAARPVPNPSPGRAAPNPLVR